ncbi:MAG: peptidase U32 family protein [Elusimicrobiota bacterium]
MELLAPAGSKESFIAAVRAGADAVYIGMPDFNARISASPINHYDLRVLTNYAHEKNVKVFLALNTLIKHEEIHEVVKNITLADSYKPDALIVQDLGIASIAAKYFPHIPLHASTQLAVHNSAGVQAAASAGFKRVILARELSFSELKLIVKGAPVETEIFCHGALCFSLSGMCLFSSFIGGLSGNRGRCTQPCRRLWKNKINAGYLFSPRDLSLAEYVDKIRNTGIASLKIEGRMRSSEYVYRAVKAFRGLIDAPENDYKHALSTAMEVLSQDMAREKTTCLFSGRDSEIFQPKKAQCLGQLIGEVESVTGTHISIKLNSDSSAITRDDRVRVSNPATDFTKAFKIKEFFEENGIYTVPFSQASEFAGGNPVFKTVDTASEQKNIEQEIDSVYDAFKKSHPHRARDIQVLQEYTSLISNAWKESRGKINNDAGAENLWIKFDDIGWESMLPAAGKGVKHVFSVSKENMRAARSISSKAGENLYFELPPFIGQRDVPEFMKFVNEASASGIKTWVLNNISHLEFFNNSGCALIAGGFLYTWNAYTAQFLLAKGVSRFVVSSEDDFLNIRKMSGPGLGSHLAVYLYGHPAVVRSRIVTRGNLDDGIISENSMPKAASEAKISSSYFPVFESDTTVLIPEKPVSVFTFRKKFRDCGIKNFGMDLSYLKPDRALWSVLIDAYQKEENIVGSLKFNFKRGVK